MREKISEAALDQLILGEMEKWQVPGMAVGVVRDGKVVYARGLGTRCAGKELGVTADTLFPIGSATKAFTSMAVALLADEGKLDWDSPIKRYLPDFRMYDALAGERLTVRDMLCHRTGIPRHEFMWYRADITRRQIMERLQDLEPNKDFRTAWQYNNGMYAAVGYLIEVVSGMTWEEFVRTRIFEPLGMDRSNFSVETLKKLADVSLPHAQTGAGVGVIDYCNLDVVGPAGSINSCLSDMLKWLRLHLDMGSVNGRQLVSRESMAQLHEMHIPCQPFAWKFDELQASGYGLGWFTDVFRGRRMVSHGGNIDGFSALVGFLPDENAGVVMLSNLNYNFMTYALMYTIFDSFLAAPETDWFVKEKKELDAFLTAMGEAQKKQTAPESGGEPELPARELSRYAGTYRSVGYGSVKISAVGNGLVMSFNGMDFPLLHKTGDTFSFTYELLSVSFPARFHFGADSGADTLSIPFEQTVKDIVFDRMQPGCDTAKK